MYRFSLKSQLCTLFNAWSVIQNRHAELRANLGQVEINNTAAYLSPLCIWVPIRTDSDRLQPNIKLTAMHMNNNKYNYIINDNNNDTINNNT